MNQEQALVEVIDVTDGAVEFANDERELNIASFPGFPCCASLQLVDNGEKLMGYYDSGNGSDYLCVKAMK